MLRRRYPPSLAFTGRYKRHTVVLLLWWSLLYSTVVVAATTTMAFHLPSTAVGIRFDDAGFHFDGVYPVLVDLCRARVPLDMLGGRSLLLLGWRLVRLEVVVVGGYSCGLTSRLKHSRLMYATLNEPVCALHVPGSIQH